MNDKNISSWSIPAFLAGCAFVGLYYAQVYFGLQLWLVLIALLGVVLISAAVANLVEYIVQKRADALEIQTSMLSRTADSVLMSEARMLAAHSPELASEMAKRVGRPDLILFTTQQGRQAQIKLAGSEVTLQFALKVLNLSDDIYMAAQRNFSEGTYLYDSNREMPDRKQWQQLNWLLARDSIVQRYVPGMVTNLAPMWLPPWNPQRILDNWLMPTETIETLQQLLNERTEE